MILMLIQVDCVEAQASDLSPSVSATCSQGFMRVRGECHDQDEIGQDEIGHDDDIDQEKMIIIIIIRWSSGLANRSMVWSMPETPETMPASRKPSSSPSSISTNILIPQVWDWANDYLSHSEPVNTRQAQGILWGQLQQCKSTESDNDATAGLSLSWNSFNCVSFSAVCRWRCRTQYNILSFGKMRIRMLYKGSPIWSKKDGRETEVSPQSVECHSLHFLIHTNEETRICHCMYRCTFTHSHICGGYQNVSLHRWREAAEVEIVPFPSNMAYFILTNQGHPLSACV